MHAIAAREVAATPMAADGQAGIRDAEDDLRLRIGITRDEGDRRAVARRIPLRREWEKP
jgi:hypothetical protein